MNKLLKPLLLTLLLVVFILSLLIFLSKNGLTAPTDKLDVGEDEREVEILLSENEDPNIIKQEFDETGNVVLEIYKTEDGIGYLEETEAYRLVYFAFHDGFVDFAIHYLDNEGEIETGNFQLEDIKQNEDFKTEEIKQQILKSAGIK